MCSSYLKFNPSLGKDIEFDSGLTEEGKAVRVFNEEGSLVSPVPFLTELERRAEEETSRKVEAALPPTVVCFVRLWKSILDLMAKVTQVCIKVLLIHDSRSHRLFWLGMQEENAGDKEKLEKLVVAVKKLLEGKLPSFHKPR